MPDLIQRVTFRSSKDGTVVATTGGTLTYPSTDSIESDASYGKEKRILDVLLDSSTRLVETNDEVTVEGDDGGEYTVTRVVRNPSRRILMDVEKLG